MEKMSELPERISKRKVTTNHQRPALTIGKADLDELDVEGGDKLKVVTYKDRIVITRLEE